MSVLYDIFKVMAENLRLNILRLPDVVPEMFCDKDSFGTMGAALWVTHFSCYMDKQYVDLML